MKRLIYVALALAITFGACTSCDEPTTSNNDFDREAMLQNYCDNAIKPAYTLLQTEINQLDADLTAFKQNADVTTLVTLIDQSTSVYLVWQSCSAFEIGPAENVSLRSSVNTFPLDTALLQSNIASGSYNLAAASNIDAKGFPALDYILYCNGTFASQVLQALEDTNTLQYLCDVVADLKSNINTVSDEWLVNNYCTTFTTSTGTDIGSSLGLLVNQFILDYENLKNGKIGIPLGKKTLGIARPETIEARCSGTSADLAIVNLTASKNIFTGGSGSGLDNYLDTLNAQYQGQLLSNAIINQYDVAIAKLQAVKDLNKSLEQAIAEDNAVVDDAYVELQKLVPLLKSDMSSALGIQITFQDNDGD